MDDSGFFLLIWLIYLNMISSTQRISSMWMISSQSIHVRGYLLIDNTYVWIATVAPSGSILTACGTNGIAISSSLTLFGILKGKRFSIPFFSCRHYFSWCFATAWAFWHTPVSLHNITTSYVSYCTMFKTTSTGIIAATCCSIQVRILPGTHGYGSTGCSPQNSVRTVRALNPYSC